MSVGLTLMFVCLTLMCVGFIVDDFWFNVYVCWFMYVGLTFMSVGLTFMSVGFIVNVYWLNVYVCWFNVDVCRFNVDVCKFNVDVCWLNVDVWQSIVKVCQFYHWCLPILSCYVLVLLLSSVDFIVYVCCFYHWCLLILLPVSVDLFYAVRCCSSLNMLFFNNVI